MRKILLATAAVSLFALPAAAQSFSQPQWYGTVGYTALDAEGADLGALTGRIEEDGESVNYGVGGNYFFDANNGIRADWTRRDFTDDNGGEVDTYGVSYIRRF